MGLSVRTLDNGRVDVTDTDFTEENATGRIIGVHDTERYDLGEQVEFDGDARVEIASIEGLNEKVSFEIVKIIDYTELGYMVEDSEDERRHVEIDSISD